MEVSSCPEVLRRPKEHRATESFQVAAPDLTSRFGTAGMAPGKSPQHGDKTICERACANTVWGSMPPTTSQLFIAASLRTRERGYSMPIVPETCSI